MEINSEIVSTVPQPGQTAMLRDPLKFRLAHALVRIVTTANLLHLLMGLFLPGYFRFALSLFSQGGDIYWMLASSILLPLYVAFETWWMFGVKPSQKRALTIDWLLAVLWFVIWWAVTLHSIYRYYPFWP